MGELENKENRLSQELRNVHSLVVAYSGGVDSAYLAYASHSERGRKEAEACVARVQFPHEFIETGELSNPAYRANNPDRCCLCKDQLFEKLDPLAARRDFVAVTYRINVERN